MAQVACNPLYSGTHQIMTKFLPKYNIELTWVPSGCAVEEYRKAVRPNTKVGGHAHKEHPLGLQFGAMLNYHGDHVDMSRGFHIEHETCNFN